MYPVFYSILINVNSVKLIVFGKKNDFSLKKGYFLVKKISFRFFSQLCIKNNDSN